jgi:hypothetical protein
LARILSSLAAAGYPCEHVEVADAFVLANGAIDDASADCGGETWTSPCFRQPSRLKSTDDRAATRLLPVRAG